MGTLCSEKAHLFNGAHLKSAGGRGGGGWADYL